MLSDTLLLADPLYFDSFERIDDHADRLTAADRSCPDGWTRAERWVWIGLNPPDVMLPSQGWKIHVSVTSQHAAAAVDAVWEYCVTHRLHFKFLRSRMAHRVLNMKYGTRGASGKLAVVYPVDEAQLVRTLTDLGATLAGLPGPYVLGDLRWQDGPLYVRYGAFVDDWAQVADTGEWELVIRRPDGVPVPDRREPVFRVPDWVTLPDALGPSYRRLFDASVEFPYSDVEPLHFSNAGGVYAANRTTDDVRVVLKEARPHAGLDPSGADAVDRLRTEAENLARLRHTGVTPALHRRFAAWEHEFLEIEHVAGTTLAEQLPHRYPFVHPDPSPERISEYVHWATRVAYGVESAIAEVHGNGLIYGDLHPNNVMVHEDGNVSLIDLELAQPLGAESEVTLGDPGFRTSTLRSGVEVDRYALAVLRLHLLVPATSLLYFGWRERNPAVLTALLDEAESRFPSLPRDFLAPVRHIVGRYHRSDGAWRPSRPAHGSGVGELIDGLVDGIHAGATPRRPDRLFPGAPEQQAPCGPLSLAYGAAGVLQALKTVGHEVPREYVTWLADRAVAAPVTRIGLYDGLLGVVEVLAQFGVDDAATALLDRCRPHIDGVVKADVFDGLAGAVLALAGAGQRQDLEALAEARKHADRLANALLHPRSDRVLRVPDRAGLMHGRTGLALCLTICYRLFGDPRYLDAAELTLSRDLDDCAVAEGGALHVDEGYRILLYLRSGSVGIGVALQAFLEQRYNARFADSLAAVRRTCAIDFALLPGLFDGTAGVLYGARAITPTDQELLERHRRQVRRRLVHREGKIFCPGDGLIRLSSDLATGSAGVLLALSSGAPSWTGLPGFASDLVSDRPGVTDRINVEGR